MLDEMVDGRRVVPVVVAGDLAVETYDNRHSIGELRYLYNEVFVHDEYGAALAGLPLDPVVVDVGANLGLFTLRVLRDHPRARVVAVEPVPGTAALLRRNVARRGQVEVVAAALGRARGEVVMTAFRNVLANSTSHPEEKPQEWYARMRAWDPGSADELLATESVGVPVTTLDAVWPDGAERVDLVKIDVEGAELDVLHGVRDDLWARIDRVVVEVQDAGVRSAQVASLLQRRGFACSEKTPAMMGEDMGCRVLLASRPGNA